jgi:hypothetical protein
VFENRVLRRIFGPKRDEVTGEWRRLHNDELPHLYSPHSIRMIRSRRNIWVGHVAPMEERRGEVRTGFLWVNLKKRDNLEDLGVDWRIILKMDLQEIGWGLGVDDLAHDRDKRRVLMNAVMNFRVP